MNKHRLALDNVSEPVFSLDEGYWEKGLQASRESPRKRMILPVHRKQDALVQRMFNFLQPGTYIRPHRHPGNGATESLVVLNGLIDFFIFGDTGKILNHTLIGGITDSVLDIEPNIWHTFIVREKDTVLFEVKKGPYNPMTDKEFASWAPEEYTSESVKYLSNLMEHS